MRGGSLDGSKVRSSWKKCPTTLLSIYTIKMLNRCKEAADLRDVSRRDDTVSTLDNPSVIPSSLFTADHLFLAFSKSFMEITPDTTPNDLPLVWATNVNDATKHWGVARLADISPHADEPTPDLSRNPHSALAARRFLPDSEVRDQRPYRTVAPKGRGVMFAKDVCMKQMMKTKDVYINTIMHLRFYLYHLLKYCADRGEKWEWDRVKGHKVMENLFDQPIVHGIPYGYFFDTTKKGIEGLISVTKSFAIKDIQNADQFIHWDPTPTQGTIKERGNQMTMADRWSIAIEGFDHDVIRSLFAGTYEQILTFSPYTNISRLDETQQRANNSIQDQRIGDSHVWGCVEFLMLDCRFTKEVISGLMEARLLWCFGRSFIWKAFENDTITRKLTTKFQGKYKPPDLRYFENQPEYQQYHDRINNP
jgi:hypothetical protein